mmetsp:Transcript_24971/g.58939  ORF Transcript_24971/g.58939 Transcript_24971/m.58939 type:complete len:255 (+) Transcript_24971:253-1017(+)
MPKPIDYSKWDHLDVSSSEDESDDNNGAIPRVTRLEAPSTVTFGGGSSALQASSKLLAASTNRSALPRAGSTGTTDASSPPPSWTERGGSASIDNLPLYWAQDRYAVTLRLELGEGDAVATVDLQGILPYRDRCAAVGTTLTRVAVRSKSGRVLLEDTLPHPVHGAEEDGNEPEADWSVEPVAWNNKKYLTLVLHKAVPMHGLSLWWRRPLQGVPEIDLARAKGSDEAASKDFLKAWEQAHELFREGKRTAKKT